MTAEGNGIRHGSKVPDRTSGDVRSNAAVSGSDYLKANRSAPARVSSPPRIRHPWPSERFAITNRRWEPSATNRPRSNPYGDVHSARLTAIASNTTVKTPLHEPPSPSMGGLGWGWDGI